MESTRDFELAEKRRLWQERLDEWKAGGLTQAEHCRRNRITVSPQRLFNIAKS